jgi:hypothetical protein
VVKRIAVCWIAACSGGSANKPYVVEDARAGAVVVPVALAPAPPLPQLSTAPYRVEPGAFAKGDAQLRVEWKDPPLEARASGGRTKCNTAKGPAVAPTTTWGIPDVIVMIEVDHGKDFAAAGPPRIVIAKCELAPHVLVVAPKVPLIVASGSAQPQQLDYSTLEPAHPLALPPEQVAKAALAKPLLLPIIGHEVALTLDPGAIVALRAEEDLAIVVTPTQPYYAVTEANGQAVLRDVPVGTFVVRALLPARGGQLARIAHGTVTVVAGGLAEVTLSL